MRHSTWDISARASALHRDALVWDNHGCMPLEHTERWLDQLARYRASGVDVAMINIGDADNPLETLIRMAATVRDYVARNPEHYVLAVDTATIRAAKSTGKLAIALDVEGVYALGSQVSLVPLLYDLGVRWMLLVYNRANLAGSGCHDEKDCGLTALGREFVREMDRVGLVKCCSHTGHRTAMEVFEHSTRPTIFSHSNPRALHDHPRNIPDELIDACARSDGVVCVNGIGIFLGDYDIGVERFVDHVDYVVQRAGPSHVGIGLDYVFDMARLNAAPADSGNFWPEGFGYRSASKCLPPEQLPAVTEELLKRGYDEESVRGILGGNLLRVADEVWRR